MKNTNLKNKNGITLIALIITIIVMLILVAVTISMAVNGGLFGYAGNAAKQTEEAKQKELGWANLQNGLTTDQLIAKYTTDREKDLELLRRAFVDNDQDARDIIEENGSFVNVDLCDACLINYHGYYYRPIGNGDDGFSDIVAYELNEKEKLFMKITSLEEQYNMEAAIYNNNIYVLVESQDTIFGYEYENIGPTSDYNDKAVVCFAYNHIIITPTSNQTWSMWAEEQSGDDLTVQDTTLKQIIRTNYTAYTYIDDVTNPTDLNYNTNISVGHIYIVHYNERTV